MQDQDLRISIHQSSGSALTQKAIPLRGGEAHVWEIPLVALEGDFSEYRKLLSPDERTRASRFHFEKDSRKFTIARGSLRSILGSYTGIAASDLRFVCGEHGKPALTDDRDDLRFNVSHSGELAMIAIARGQEVGVDVEAISEDVETDKLAERFFSARERAAIRALPSKQRVAAFYRCWTCKEAFLKAQGVGLFRGLGSFDVEVNPNASAHLLSTRPDTDECNRWSLHEIKAATGYAAAIAIEGAISAMTILRSTESPAS